MGAPIGFGGVSVLPGAGQVTSTMLATDVTRGEHALTQFYTATSDDPYRDLYRSGWLPGWFNQQWGGAQWGTLPDGSFGCVATGSIEDNSFFSLSQSSAGYYNSTSFKVSESFTLDAVWVKLYKVGNPTVSLTARIYTDSGGSPSAATGSAATLSCKLVTSKTDGEWYQITGLAAALTAGTQYHLVLTLGAVYASDYINWKITTTKKYPNGYFNYGTNVPAWTPQTAYSGCFLIQSPAANALIQSGGQFDYRLAFANGSPQDQSRCVAQPLANFFDVKNCSVLHRGTYAASSNVWDFAYGIDHDRITLTINSSGYPVLTIYENTGTTHTVTGTGSVTTGFHDVGIKVRSVGDGSDYAYLYVDGASVGTPVTAATITFDNLMARLGTARLGDGFGLAPTWTGNAMTDTAQLPSHANNGSWTWTGTATEANAMSMQGGKLYQNANGYTSTQTGYYVKTLTLNNSTGWTVSWKVRAPSASNDAVRSGVSVGIQDGAKTLDIQVNEYFVLVGQQAGTQDSVVQGDFKSQDHVFTCCGKGSDYYLFIDGKLAVDGTGKLTVASAGNNILFADYSAYAGNNADAIWSYVKYYTGGTLLPTANSGSCSEFAHWSGDKSALFSPLWNAGTPVSVKQLCGVPRNYQFEQVVQREVRKGIVSTQTTSSTTATALPDMECYTVGSYLDAEVNNTVSNATVDGAQHRLGVWVDGVWWSAGGAIVAQDIANYRTKEQATLRDVYQLGLHKVDSRWWVASGTATAHSGYNSFSVEAKS